VHVDIGGHPALRGVDLALAPGELVAITGPNGAGKSTLLEAIAGVRVLSRGLVHTTTSALAYVPQRTAVPEGLPITVREIVAIGAWGGSRPFRRLGAAGRRAIDDALERVALRPLAHRPFAALSGGQRQRALLAQGLARRADLLLLDEPTTGLDADSARRILEAVRDEARRGAAVVCVTHDDAVVAASSRVVRLEAGRIA
jgi:zinc/manganese transport system ATP-binding protein